MKLKITNVSFSYDKEPVMVNFSLSIEEGEFVSLIGPSGSGKSTLFYLIGGLYQPDQGDIYLDGKRVNGQRGNIGYMPQQPSLLPWRTVKKNILLGQELSRSPITLDVERLLKKAKLEGMEDQYPHQLSGGMQQRVSFLRTLMSNHSLLCLDEPFGALDALTRTEMQYWLQELLKEFNYTVLFITHSIEEALLLSDRIYVLGEKPMQVRKEIAIPFADLSWEQKRYDKRLIHYRQEIEQLLALEGMNDETAGCSHPLREIYR